MEEAATTGFARGRTVGREGGREERRKRKKKNGAGGKEAGDE